MTQPPEPPHERRPRNALTPEHDPAPPPDAGDGPGRTDALEVSAGPPGGCLADAPVRRVPVNRLRVHPFVERIPRMPRDQLEVFLEDVNGRGVQHPLTVTPDDRILDGRHRYEAAIARGDTDLPCRVVDLDEEGVPEFVLREAITRRHLTDDQRAILAAEWHERQIELTKRERAAKGGKAGGRGRPKASDSLADETSAELSDAIGPRPQRASTRSEAAAAYRVSEGKLRQATLLKRSHPELAGAVLRGDLPLREAVSRTGTGTADAPAGADDAADDPAPEEAGTEPQPPATLDLPPDAGDDELARRIVAALGAARAVRVALLITEGGAS